MIRESEYHWGTVVVVESVGLALDSGLVGDDPPVGSESGVGHPDMVVDLHDLLGGSGLLELGH